MEIEKIIKLINANMHILFTGPPGTGKTRTAKIVSEEVKKTLFIIDGNVNYDYLENIIIENESPLIFIDEIHSLGKKCQTALLSVLEEGKLFIKYITILTPAIFIGATTDAWQLSLPLRNRFFEIKFDVLSDNEMEKAIKNKFPELELDIFTLKKVIDLTQGIPRKMVQIIRSILAIYGEISLSAIEKYKLDQGIVDSLNSIQIKILEVLFEKELSLTSLSNRLIQNKSEIQLNETFLLRQGYIQINSKGRALTNKGIEFVQKKLIKK